MLSLILGKQFTSIVSSSYWWTERRWMTNCIASYNPKSWIIYLQSVPRLAIPIHLFKGRLVLRIVGQRLPISYLRFMVGIQFLMHHWNVQYRANVLNQTRPAYWLWLWMDVLKMCCRLSLSIPTFSHSDQDTSVDRYKLIIITVIVIIISDFVKDIGSLDSGSRQVMTELPRCWDLGCYSASYVLPSRVCKCVWLHGLGYMCWINSTSVTKVIYI